MKVWYKDFTFSLMREKTSTGNAIFQQWKIRVTIKSVEVALARNLYARYDNDFVSTD